MIDGIREILERLIRDAAILAAETSANTNTEFDGQIVIDWRHGLSDFVTALDSLALIVPRSDIQGYEYSYRYTRPDDSGYIRYPASDREEALNEVAQWEERPRNEGRVWAEERPVLSWTPIPLPEEADS